MSGWRLKATECAQKITRCWSRWDKKLMRFLARFAWLIIGMHLLFAGAYYYTTLSTPPLPSIEKRVYEHHKGKYEDGDGKSVSLEAKNKSADIASTKQQESSSNDQAIKDLQEYIRSARDLNAQEGMWRAANFLSVLTAVQVIFGAFALLFIYDTLLATRRTLSEAQAATAAAIRASEAAESAERAYVLAHITFKECADPPLSRHSSPRMDMALQLTNIGRTPAINVEWSVARIGHDESIKIDQDSGVIPFIPAGEFFTIYQSVVRWDRPRVLVCAFDVFVKSYKDVFGFNRGSRWYVVSGYSDHTSETDIIDGQSIENA